MIYVAAAAGVCLCQIRGIFGILLSKRRMLAGDYDGAIRRARWTSLRVPNVMSLHTEGLILSLAGRPEEAERCYRTALVMARGSARQVERLHSLLGYALMDLGRYDESEACFHRAIEAGDHTGISQDLLAEIRLTQGREAAEALNFANQAIQHASRRPDRCVPGAYYAHRAWALALLGRREEAREALDKAMQEKRTSTHGFASLQWRAGMVLLAMGCEEDAEEHFRTGAEADPRGKYSGRCRERLEARQAAKANSAVG